MDDATRELAHSLEGCELIELDSAELRPSCTVATQEGRFLKLSPAAGLLVRGVRERRSLAELAARAASTPAEVAAACRVLAERISALRRSPRHDVAPGLVLRREWLQARTVRALSAPLTRLCGPVPMAVLGSCALAIVIGVLSSTPTPKLTIETFWIAYALCLPLLFVHELGHAATCARHGAEVGPIGVALFYIYPALYCDVTAAWKLHRWQRVAIDLGGIYIQLVVTAGIALAWLWSGSTVLYAVTAMSVGIVLTNLIPFFSLDGYWCLSDALGVVNLRTQRRALVAALWARMRGRPSRPLPWSMPIVIFVVLYSAAAIAFGAYVIWRLLPRAFAQIVSIPGHARDLCVFVAGGDGLGALAAAGKLATAALVALFTFSIGSRALRAGLRILGGQRTP